MAKPGVNVTRLTMGPNSAAVKRRATPQQWRKIIRKAKRRGVTVESLLDQSVPMALKQRTRAGLQKQATSTIQAAYAPAETSISQQESRVRSVDEKRARDNQYYLDWLRSRSDQMQAASKQADTVLRDTHKQIVDEAGQQAQALRQDMLRGAAATTGNVSDPNQATAFDTRADAARNAGVLASSQAATNNAIGSQESRRASLDASNFAFMAASEAKRTSDTWAKLAELGDEKQKLALSKAADSAKEVARLLDQEQVKAESNREYKAVAQKLGVDLAGIEQRDRASQRSANQQRLNRKATNKRARDQLRLQQSKQAFQEGLDEAELAIKQGNLDLGWYRATHPNKGKGGGATPGKPMEGDAQGRFEYGYALVASSVRQGKPRKDGTYPNKPYNRDWVAKNYNLVANQLVKKGFSRRMAKTIVNAFIQKAGGEPGPVENFRPSGYTGPN